MMCVVAKICVDTAEKGSRKGSYTKVRPKVSCVYLCGSWSCISCRTSLLARALPCWRRGLSHSEASVPETSTRFSSHKCNNSKFSRHHLDYRQIFCRRFTRSSPACGMVSWLTKFLWITDTIQILIRLQILNGRFSSDLVILSFIFQRSLWYARQLQWSPLLHFHILWLRMST